MQKKKPLEIKCLHWQNETAFDSNAWAYISLCPFSLTRVQTVQISSLTEHFTILADQSLKLYQFRKSQSSDFWLCNSERFGRELCFTSRLMVCGTAPRQSRRNLPSLDTPIEKNERMREIRNPGKFHAKIENVPRILLPTLTFGKQIEQLTGSITDCDFASQRLYTFVLRRWRLWFHSQA